MFYGNINTATKYVCDNSVFRTANKIEIEADSACTSYNRNEYYILPKYDGKNNYSYYKCTEKGWTFTTEKLNQGSMIDERDEHKYKTIGIRTQMWMAENLNYSDSVNYPSMLGKNWCYENNLENCTEYGRLYTWGATIDSVYWGQIGKICGYREKPCDLPNDVRGICPKGWHIPSSDEWNTLYSTVGNHPQAMMGKGFPEWTIATDEFGFSALPAGAYGNYMEEDGFHGLGTSTLFWTTKDKGNEAEFLGFDRYGADFNSVEKFYGFSVRCIKDEE